MILTRLWFVLLGAVAIMVFASMVLVVVPESMLDRLPVPEELEPYDDTVAYGREVYISEGCVYCHTQQVRDASFTTDEARGWGRPTVPSDYVYDEPHLLGTMRTGPDLVNVGARMPSRQWHLLHLYQPRAVVPWSIMPSFRYLFRVVPTGTEDLGERVEVPEEHAPDGDVYATTDASALVDYLLSLDRTYPPAIEEGGSP